MRSDPAAAVGPDMTLLVSDAIAHIRHTLASEDVPSIGAYRILNDAGQYMVNMHNWAWCEGAQQTLSLTANQDYVWLPEDFREIIAVQPTNGLNQGFRLTTQERLLQLRSLAVANSFEFNGTVVYAPRAAAAGAKLTLSGVSNTDNIVISDAYNPVTRITFAASIGSGEDNTAFQRYALIGSSDTTAASALASVINDAPNLYVRASASGAVVTLTHQRPGTRGNSLDVTSTGGSVTVELDDTGVDGGPVRARLELWPSPSQDETDRLMVYYRRGWQSCDSDNALIPIPEWMETLYINIVRAFARGYERESEGPSDVRLAQIKQGPVYAAAQLRDKEAMQHMGPLRGGAVSAVRSMYDHMWNFSSVANPS